MKQRFVVLLFLATLLPLFASAQTTQPYFANSGSVSSFNTVKGYPLTANLPGGSTVSGGDFNSPYGMGGQCYWGGCPNWPFYNYPLSYVLPMDNSTASFTNFTGTADFSSTHCSVSPQCIFAKGTAGGVDSLGRSVSVSISWEVAAYCRSGRGGGCTKKLVQAEMDVTTN
jgi:hypothetical protein